MFSQIRRNPSAGHHILENVQRAWVAWVNVWRANIGHVHQILLAGFVINVLGLTLPLFSSIVYDKIIGNNALASLWALAIGMLIGVVLDFILRQARVYIVELVGARWDKALDERVFAGLLKTSLETPPEVGPVLARYREVMATRDFLSSAYLIPIIDLPFILLFLIVIWLIGGSIVIVPIILGALLLAVSMFGHHVAKRYQTRHIRDANHKISLLAEAIATLETLKRPKSGSRVAQRFIGLSETSAHDGAHARIWHSLYQSLISGVSTLSSVGTLVIGVYLVESRSLTTGGLIACSMLVGRCVMLFGSVSTLANRYQEFVRSVGDLSTYVNLAEGKKPLVVKKSKDELASADFILSNVTFKRKHTERAVLNEINLNIPENQFVAIVGRAGSGKTTLLKMLSGRLSLSAGSLIVGGVEVNDKNMDWLASKVGYKAQDPQFIRSTVGELLADSGEKATPKERLEILNAVGLETAIRVGEISLSTNIGNFGNGVSGGQKQMLALACALLQSNKILLLDEPTLGLDSVALNQVIKLLGNLKNSRTIIVVTHAPEVINLADRLVVVGEGKIMADGPKEKLLVNQ